MPQILRALAVPLLVAATLAGMAGCTSASPVSEVRPQAPGVGLATSRRCSLIDVGTPQRPRMVPDPACGSGSGR